MKIIVAMLFAALTLTGCATLNSGLQKTSESQQLETLCNVAPGLHLAFFAFAAQGVVSQTVQKREYEAWLVLRQICDDRPANVNEALLTALSAYQHILNAQNEAAKAARRAQI